jgi:hypothetical protein
VGRGEGFLVPAPAPTAVPCVCSGALFFGVLFCSARSTGRRRLVCRSGRGGLGRWPGCLQSMLDLVLASSSARGRCRYAHQPLDLAALLLWLAHGLLGLCVPPPLPALLATGLRRVQFLFDWSSPAPARGTGV